MVDSFQNKKSTGTNKWWIKLQHKFKINNSKEKKRQNKFVSSLIREKSSFSKKYKKSIIHNSKNCQPKKELERYTENPKEQPNKKLGSKWISVNSLNLKLMSKLIL